MDDVHLTIDLLARLAESYRKLGQELLDEEHKVASWLMRERAEAYDAAADLVHRQLVKGS